MSLTQRCNGAKKDSRLPEPLVMFKKFGDNALEFELHVWIYDINERHQVRSTLHQDLDRRLRDAGITIAFPQRDIHIRHADQPMPLKANHI